VSLRLFFFDKEIRLRIDVSGVGSNPHSGDCCYYADRFFYCTIARGSLVDEGLVFDMSTDFKVNKNIIEDLPP
jgi:hypothetical protein